MSDETDVTEKSKARNLWVSLGIALLVVLALAVGAYLRFTGLNWDEDQHLHPDERFLTMVSTAISTVQTSGAGYFDTANSNLNPHNRGYTFYVYGTLPLFVARYVGEWLDQIGYSEIHLVGRALSATVDWLVVLLVFLTATRLYDRRVGALAAAFYALAVLPIQQSHFYTVDTFASFFMMLAFYAAAVVASARWRAASHQSLPIPDETPAEAEQTPNLHPSRFRDLVTHPLLLPSLVFGFALGMAVASKINAAPIALILPLAAGLYLLKLPAEEQRKQIWLVFLSLALAALASLVAFRIFQPYAFSGPGFFGLRPNQAWLDNLSALRAQTGGDVDFPPALQWARRPLTFSWQNLVLWGLGLPLGILAWAGFAFMAWRMLKGQWQKHILLWGWTAVYFSWQSLQWNSTMRYQLPIYPLLAIMAAWLVFEIYDRKAQSKVARPLVIAVVASVLLLTAAWAFAFMGIYPKDHTRIAAARWLLQEMPGPITLPIQTAEGLYRQPLPFYEGTLIRQGQPYITGFEARRSGLLSQIQLPHVADQNAVTNPATLAVQVTYATGEPDPLATGQLTLEAGDDQLAERSIPLDPAVPLYVGETYQITLDVSGGDSEIQVCAPVFFEVIASQGKETRPVYLPQECLGRYQLPITLRYTPTSEADLIGILLHFGEYRQPYAAGIQTLRAELYSDSQTNPLASGFIQSDFAPDPQGDTRGAAYQIDLDPPVTLEEGARYSLRFTLEDGPGALQFAGAAAANESSWDDGLPLRIDGYDPYGGIYRGGLNFEMYWDDNAEKFERFVTTLDAADYVLISSSRQWGTTPRVPERYPLTSEYYRHLLGCPVEQTIEWCFNVAQVGTFEGNLGFELVKTFEASPTLGGLTINDQFSEEAFTVYDHPKVFVFKKTADYDPERVREILGAVDLSKVIRITPKQADGHPGNLMLPPNHLAEQRSGGTWSDLFDYESFQNKYPVVTVVLWYLAVSVLGWLSYPFVRFALPGLADRGYPLARLAGLLLLAYFSWLAGSLGLMFGRGTIAISLGLIALLGLALAYHQRAALRAEWRANRRYFLLVEGLILVFFLFGLLVRWGNPDLWHPWKGGEKPMDFSYFNAVLKSTSFPPYDPWFAGGYINYYYYGFVIVGTLVKLLGIVPAIAYNLILPTLLALMAIGAFSVAWNLVGKPQAVSRKQQDASYELQDASGDSNPLTRTPLTPGFFAGLAAALSMALAGNLGTLRMIFDGFKMNAASPGGLEGAGWLTRVLWGFKGFFMSLTGAPLPYRMDEWYWNPSRVIAADTGGPITEFPYFTFLYGDLHAHLIALPVALLAITWALSVVLGKAWSRPAGRSFWQIGASLFLGGLAIGALYPINLSDIYTYLPLGIAALIYGIWLYGRAANRQPRTARDVLSLLAAVLALVLLALFLYQPYSQWYGQGYSQIQLWRGLRTPLGDYLTHWGGFLFIFISWMIYESIDWMASTPVSALRTLQPYRTLILGVLAVLGVIILLLGINLYPQGVPFEETLPLGLGVHVIWLVLPLLIWAGVLLLRPHRSDARRFALFLLGTGLTLTLMVEIIVVSGDIGRMNTVFKFYLHAWTLFSVTAGAVLIWLWQSLPKWNDRWRILWQIGLIFVVSSALLYPLTATFAKIQDRMAPNAPRTLDGMAYMQYATLYDLDTQMDLSQDYNAIRWLQDNIAGSPVIVEGHLTEYRWGTRNTIYTGLPGVIGWNWHQRQQRTLLPDTWVWERVNAVDEFYQTTDLQTVTRFLDRFDVSYIILGQLERAKYAGAGLEKFESQNGTLWREVFRDRDTVIFEVLNR